jgi:hypothetical protein
MAALLRNTCIENGVHGAMIISEKQVSPVAPQ